MAVPNDPQLAGAIVTIRAESQGAQAPAESALSAGRAVALVQ